MRKLPELYKTKSAVTTVAITLALLLAGAPKATETMAISNKLKWMSRKPDIGVNRIISYQNNPNLPVIADISEPFKIVHIGDSHIQAGFLTGEVRRLLANFYCDSTVSIGYIFPYNLAGTNSPREYTFKSNSSWVFKKILTSDESLKAGLSGIAMETSDTNPSLSVSLKNQKLGDKLFDEITVLIDNSTNNFTIEVEGLASEVVSKNREHIKLRLQNAIPEATLIFKGEGKLSLSGLILENSASKIIYHSAGLNGADVKSYLRAGELASHLEQINPQLVIVSLGTNDAYHPLFDANTFSAMLGSFINKIKQAAPESTILLTVPGDHLVSRTNTNPNLLLVKEAIITSAIENGCCVWDFHSLMGGEGSIKTWSGMGLTAPDLLHLNVKGYQLQGELLFEALTNSN